MFSFFKFLKRFENLQKRAPWSSFNDYLSKHEGLLNKADRSSLNVNKITDFMSEIYKAINNLNTDFVKETFALKDTRRPTKEQ